MKEQFRYKKFRTMICIKYVDANGDNGVFETNQQELMGLIIAIVDLYRAEGHKMSGRQLFYQLVRRNIIPNAEKVYKRVLALLVDMRYNGLIDWSDIEDRGRVPTKHAEWDSIEDIIKTAVASYRLPRWDDQDYYVELYCEKQALEGVLKPVADKYHIYYGSNKGYNSASTMYDIAKRFDEQERDGKICKLIYMGDHDASGLDMARDIQTRVCEFLGLEEENEYFNVEQIALNMKQVKKYKLPPNPQRNVDPRAKWYKEKYGKSSWELDALEPKVLIDLAEKAILEYIDIDKYNAWIKREKSETKALIDFGSSLT